MSNAVPLTFRSAPFPAGYKATPEQFKNDLVARLYAESSQPISFFVTGPTAPTSDVGPWFKNGTDLYVWNTISGSYVPIQVAQTSLKFIAQIPEPDPSIYIFWIALDAAGKATRINYYDPVGAAWRDVYQDKFDGYDASIAAIETAATALALNLSTNYSTTTVTTAAIVASAAATLTTAEAYTDTSIAALKTYPAQAVKLAQTIAIDVSPHKITFDTAPINPSPAPFNTTSNRYIIPANGIYLVSVTSQFDNSTGTPAGMAVKISLYKNGSFIGNCMDNQSNIPSPNGNRWFPSFSGLVQGAIADYLEVYADASDGVNTGNLTLVVAQISVVKVG